MKKPEIENSSIINITEALDYLVKTKKITEQESSEFWNYIIDNSEGVANGASITNWMPDWLEDDDEYCPKNIKDICRIFIDEFGEPDQLGCYW